MKFEKITDNKIKITFSVFDLEERDISLHDFMSNSLESQDLFWDMLEEAEEKIGFKANNCKIKIEALAMKEDNFVLTITKILPNTNKKTNYIVPKVRPKVKRKSDIKLSSHLIYKFNTFDDYCYFIEFLLKSNLADAYKIAEKIVIYTYHDFYYLDLYKLNEKYIKISKFLPVVTEFGSYILNPDLFVCKLNELGTIFLKNNALKKSLSVFSKK